MLYSPPGLLKDPPGPPRTPHALHDGVPAGGEVIAGAVEEGDTEVEEQVDEQRAGVLRQEHLRTDRQTGGGWGGGGDMGTDVGRDRGTGGRGSWGQTEGGGGRDGQRDVGWTEGQRGIEGRGMERAVDGRTERRTEGHGMDRETEKHGVDGGMDRDRKSHRWTERQRDVGRTEGWTKGWTEGQRTTARARRTWDGEGT